MRRDPVSPYAPTLPLLGSNQDSSDPESAASSGNALGSAAVREQSEPVASSQHTKAHTKSHTGFERIDSIIPRALRGLEVTPGMFQTPAHYRAWLDGHPIRTERPKRWRVPARWRDAVMRHYGYRCQGQECETPQATPTIEHIVPVVLGGSNQPSNLTVLCAACQARSWARFRDVLKAVDDEAAA